MRLRYTTGGGLNLDVDRLKCHSQFPEFVGATFRRRDEPECRQRAAFFRWMTRVKQRGQDIAVGCLATKWNVTSIHDQPRALGMWGRGSRMQPQFDARAARQINREVKNGFLTRTGPTQCL